MESLSAAEARRMALAAQGFAGPRPTSAGPVRIAGVLDRLRLVQIDSVNVFERSHYLPVFARLGPYDRARLDRLTLEAGAPFVEVFAHEAAFVPRQDLPLFGFRFRRFHAKYGGWLDERASLVATLRAELTDRGPLTASEVESVAHERQGAWWGWSDVKNALELLFRSGELVTAGRRGFERRYAVPAEPLVPVPEQEAVRELVRRAAVAHGVAALPDLADYYRLLQDPVRVAIDELTEAGELVPVTVEGWTRGSRPLPAWRHRDAVLPARIRAAAVLSPFDPVVWQRDRLLRLFGFHYRISLYTPEAQREHGYYVLPVLVDDKVVGRLDLKSDRQAGVLRVQHAWTEPAARPDVALRIAPVLRAAAEWQGLSGIEVAGRGDLAPALGAELETAG